MNWNGRRKEPSDLCLIHLITMTPDMDLLYVQAADGWVEEFIDQHQCELYDEDNYDYLLREAKTSAMLMDWIGEVQGGADSQQIPHRTGRHTPLG